jgi:hypothetical protein
MIFGEKRCIYCVFIPFYKYSISGLLKKVIGAVIAQMVQQQAG